MPSINLDIIINAVDNASKQIDAFSKSVSKTALAGAAMTAAGAGILAVVGKITSSSIEMADALMLASDKTGIAASSLQTWFLAAEKSDVSTETLTKGFTKLQVAMYNTPEVFAKLGISIKDANGNMKSTEAVMLEVSTAIAGLKNEEESAAAATDIFGAKMGPGLLPLLKQGADGISALREEAKKLGMNLSDAQWKSLDDLGDNMGKLKFASTALGAQFASVLAPAIQKIIDSVGKVIEWYVKFQQAHPTLTSVITKLVTALGLIFAVVGPVILALPMIITIMTGIASACAAVVSGLIAFGTAAGAVLATVGAPVLIVIGIILALAAAAYFIIKYWEPIKAFFANLWTAIKEIFVGAWIWMKEAYMKYTLVGLIISHWSGIVDFFKNMWEKVKAPFVTFIEWVRSAGEKLWEGFMSGLQKKFPALYNAIKWVMDKIAQFFPHSDAEVGPFSQLTNSGKSLVSTFAGGIESQQSMLSGSMNKTFNGVALTGSGGSAAGNGGVVQVELKLTKDGVELVQPSQMKNLVVTVINDTNTQERVAKKW